MIPAPGLRVWKQTKKQAPAGDPKQFSKEETYKFNDSDIYLTVYIIS